MLERQASDIVIRTVTLHHFTYYIEHIYLTAIEPSMNHLVHVTELHAKVI
jgi:hypothetical protein